MAVIRIEGEVDFKSVAVEMFATAIRPLDENECAVNRLIPAELKQIVGFFNPIEIGVDNRGVPPLVALHKEKSRAWHFKIGVASQQTNQGAGEGRLSGAKAA